MLFERKKPYVDAKWFDDPEAHLKFVKCGKCNGTGLVLRGESLTFWVGEYCEKCGGQGNYTWLEMLLPSPQNEKGKE